jgi:hypothetical protein
MLSKMTINLSMVLGILEDKRKCKFFEKCIQKLMLHFL